MTRKTKPLGCTCPICRAWECGGLTVGPAPSQFGDLGLIAVIGSVLLATILVFWVILPVALNFFHPGFFSF